MDRPSTRELAYFVAVAQERHFGRAAELLGITQPPLSRAIRRLEARLGVVLLERTSRQVRPTPAGEVLLAHSLELLAALDGAVVQTQRAHESGPLLVAAAPGTGAGLLRELVDAYSRQTSAGVELVFTRDQGAALRAGAADVAVLCATDDLRDLDTLVLATEHPVALLPAGHHLAGHVELTLAELREDTAFQADCPIAPLDEILDLVAVGQLLTVVGESAADRAGSAVACVPVADLPPTTLQLAWRWGSREPATAAFVHTTRMTMDIQLTAG
jgi:DNA-binding transcriptional LysR family regulator